MNATDTPLDAYCGTPHKTIGELVLMATHRAKDGENPCEIIQDLVDGYGLGWQSANHRLIEKAAKTAAGGGNYEH